MSLSRNAIGAIFFGVLALTIVFPLLAPGFILSFDAVAVPFKSAFPSFSSSTFLFGSIWSLLSILVSTAWLQKFWLFLIFFLSGWGCFRLTGKKSLAAGIFAGCFFAVNPFVYERVMVGHWGLLFGYSLLPFIVEAVLTKKAILAAILMTLVLSVDIHFALIFSPVLLLLFLVGKDIKQTAIFAGAMLLLNLNWLIPVISGRSELSAVVNSFNVNDLIAFQSFPDPNFGLVFNLLSGYGLWTENHHYFLLPKDVLVVWPLLSLAILSITSVGVYKVIKDGETKDKILGVGLIALVILALDFSGGVALSAAKDWIIFLYDKLPVLRGLREPQKLIGLVMFAYAFWGAGGLEFLVKKRKIFLVILILPLIYAPTVFGSFWGQLRPAVYPASWSKVKTILDADHSNYLVLALPWHQYMRYRFNNNQGVYNLAPLYFGDKILSSRDYETKYLDNHETREEALHISGLLRIQKEGVNLLGEKVDSLVNWPENISIVGIKYVLLSKEEDWQDYRFLDNTENFKKTFEDENFILYENLLVLK